MPILLSEFYFVLFFSSFKIIALHSVLSSQDQSSAFNIPPKGVRKVVIATNIAETGITIPDVVFVIDAGKVKENRWDWCIGNVLSVNPLDVEKIIFCKTPVGARLIFSMLLLGAELIFQTSSWRRIIFQEWKTSRPLASFHAYN